MDGWSKLGGVENPRKRARGGLRTWVRGQTSVKRGVVLTMALAMVAGGLPVTSGVDAAPTGQGFTVSAADLSYILKQIKIAEHHANNTTDTTGPCGALLGPADDQVGNPLLSFGLRTVDGSCNNLQAGQEYFGSSHQLFPRLAAPDFRAAESSTSYATPGGGTVIDTQPRLISNLIVDQTSTNPAAVEAAGYPVRTQGNEGISVCAPNGNPVPPATECVPQHETLFIPNVTTDVGLSPPYNGLFALFGQFFDHGLDKVTNGGSGAVFVPLRADDPLIAGADHIFGNSDDLDPNLRFMVLTRATAKGPNGSREAANTDTPFVDQSQTYTSDPSHQVFLREYKFGDIDHQAVATGMLIHSADGGMATWGQVKSQVARDLGLQLLDGDVNNIPMLAVDQYGNFIPGDARGLPQFVTEAGLVEGNRDAPVPTPGNVLRIDIAFLNDIAHSAAPKPGGPDLTEGPGPDGILLDNPLTTNADESADDTDAVPAGPGPDGVQGDNPLTNDPDESADDTPGTPANGGAEDPFIGDDLNTAFDESLDDSLEIPADPGLDGILGDNPLTLNADESADDTDAIPAGPGPDGILGDNPLTLNADESADNVGLGNDVGAGGSLDTPFPAGTYDDELLDLHFIAGDGRVNENIGLTAIHQIFHSEHDRLVEDMQTTLDENPALKAAFEAVNPDGLPIPDNPATTGIDESAKTFTYGERLFQAARFVTEMEYQHLVFEEFARKVQPAIDPFEPFAFNQTDVNPAITAEFAHAVYRFGHSMLNEDIARFLPTADPNDAPNKGQHFDIPLLEGFLNPASYTDGPGSQVLNSKQAAGAVIMGMSDQVGNELDEFVTDTLRNNLLGLPLDLPTINMTRARSEGIPSLNNVRKQIFAKTHSGELAPYTNWIDFGLALKHPESLVNFVAAYGKHPSITAQSTIAGKREAARLIVEDGVGTDVVDFMTSSGSYANMANGVSLTGVDDIDLWVGGLAEVTNPFGGLLGTTFNYVFENQLVNLQNGDRFYYLARTPGMNLRAQLEGNSFAELMMRNTTATTLKADPFATADCKFEFSSNPGIATAGGTTVTDDPASECFENILLIRQPATTTMPAQIRYRSRNSIDPAGINGQSVYNGTAGDDYMWGGNDNDTFLGNEGNDIIEGGAGDDIPLGGDGDDVITDVGGDDVLKGGPDNDALDGGIGLDILMGGDGHDLTLGGGNGAESFLGAGDDFAGGGSGIDVQFGDSGDDWLQGGDQPDLLIGDSSTLFFDDHNLPGHDVTNGQGGDDDYDTEGGDDIMVGGPGVEKNAGASGFDWFIGLDDPQAQDADLNRPILAETGQPVIEIRDRYNEVEALSGWNLNDILRGDDFVPADQGGGGFIGCDALDADGVARIAGLDQIVTPAMLTVPSADIIANSTTSYCLLSGNVWGAGNILVGGAGSDIMEGRGADDIIDGDRYVSVRISVRLDKDDPSTEIGSTDLLEHQALTGSFGEGTEGMTLQQAIFARLLTAGNLAIVREMKLPAVVPPADCGTGPTVPATALNCDTAVFTGDSSGYTITVNGGVVTVTDNGGIDGIDTVRNVERLQFTDRTFTLGVAGPPTIGTATLQNPPSPPTAAVVTWTPPAAAALPAITGFLISVFENGSLTAARTQAVNSPAATSASVGSLVVGTTYRFTVTAVSPAGNSLPSALSNPVTPQPAAATLLTVAPLSPLANATGVAVDANISGIFSEALAATNGVAGTNNTATNGSQYVRLYNVATGVRINVNVGYTAGTRTFSINPSANLAVGTTYEVRVTPGTCTPPAGIRTATSCRPLNAVTTWQFTTANPAAVAPTVTAQTPAPGAAGVARGANLTVTFSEPMNAAGFNATSVRIVRVNNNTVIPATLTYNAGNRTLTINPDVNLRQATQFRVTLTGSATGIRDLDPPLNKPLVTTSFTFTTA